MSSGNTPMPSGKGDARRAAIVRATRDICAEQGFSKVTVSDIANRAHMTRSLFYHYFSDKDEVADAVLEDVVGSGPPLRISRPTMACRLFACMKRSYCWSPE